MSNYSLNSKIRNYSIVFFNTIVKIQGNGLFSDDVVLFNFPFGCCHDISELFANFLLSKKIQCNIMSGEYFVKETRYTHSWIEVNNNIIDLTILQFKEIPIFNRYKISNNYYVGKLNDFYRLFNITKIETFCGFEKISEPAKTRMLNIYNKISIFMKNEEAYNNERN